eukprot:CAMPEP_0179937054 /NCGR_PEP_ID=MMETSP0983-20121128/14094_1 /TAXON_ID=483367 /ORGANISM="non described non described, Strain CCMP 2436" /LENGTH=227 /DNA_ID=CAMNT_0021842695 /DNA_START=160 /DNA_END=840 /DNA_ORIENTATION=-
MAFTSYIRVFELRSSVRALVASVSALDWSRTALDLSMSFMPWKVLLISLQAPSRQPTLNAWIWTHDALDPPMIAGTAIASVAGMEIACTSRGVGSVTVARLLARELHRVVTSGAVKLEKLVIHLEDEQCHRDGDVDLKALDHVGDFGRGCAEGKGLALRDDAAVDEDARHRARIEPIAVLLHHLVTAADGEPRSMHDVAHFDVGGVGQVHGILMRLDVGGWRASGLG